MADIRFFSGRKFRVELGSMGVMLNITLPDGTQYKDVEPRRYFPLSDIYKYISFVQMIEDDKGKTVEEELLILKDVNNLDEDSKAAVIEALDRFYMIPKILDIYESKATAGIVQWRVLTDRGEYKFDIKDIFSSIKHLPGGKILVIDASDNRYEITDYNKFSKKGRSLLLGYL